VRDGTGTVLVQFGIVVGADIAAGENLFEMLEEGVSMAITSSKWPWMGQSFTIRILPRARSPAL